MTPPRPLNRREFIGQASCAALGSTALFSTLLNLRMASAASLASDPDDYRALVCVFLFGGNDSWNVLVPKGANETSPEYKEYAHTRSNLALSQSSIIQINPTNSDGRILGVHPGMPEIASLFDSGKLAFVTNIGSLLGPTTLSDFNNRRNLPYSLFSHSSQQEQWQTSVGQRPTAVGWGGRAADLLQSLNKNDLISMNISIAGTNIFQTGDHVYSYAVSPYGATTVRSNNTDQVTAELRETALNSQLDFEYKNLFEKTFAQATRNSIEGNIFFNDSISGTTLPANIANGFAGDYFSQQLKMVAKVIAARGQLGMKRQTFFVGWGGFDFHSGLLSGMKASMPILSKGVKAFHDAMVGLGVENNVTLFQASDFARTLSSNGDGADHAWGGNTFVMGGAVNGQKVYGTYPQLSVGTDNPLDTGQGRLIPGVSVDQYAAELALWLGVSQTDLPTVLPNIGNFYNGVGQPLGLMQM